ncbi:hypothetical protein RB195_017473 [Necator americanus]|uniref:CCHC-type domain-containing protein n=1 Tax=Necator americanus TaxID=51031 RepID=A0ABR1C5E0_NECAM
MSQRRINREDHVESGERREDPGLMEIVDEVEGDENDVEDKESPEEPTGVDLLEQEHAGDELAQHLAGKERLLEQLHRAGQVRDSVNDPRVGTTANVPYQKEKEESPGTHETVHHVFENAVSGRPSCGKFDTRCFYCNEFGHHSAMCDLPELSEPCYEGSVRERYK